MKPKHFAILGACLVSIGAIGVALPDWQSAVSPAFVFGVLGVIGSNLAALYMERPKVPEKPSDRTPAGARTTVRKYGKRVQ